MKVFLTGATGYLGQAALHRLVAEGHQVLALGRKAPGREFLQHARVKWLFADLRQADAIAQAARESDATIHTAAEHHGAMQEVDSLATDAFIEGLAGSGKPLISTSATVVYGDTGPTPRGEEGPILNAHPLRAWREQTDGLIVAAADKGVRSMVVRPPTIYGAGTGVIAARIEAARRAGFAQYVGDGAAVWSTIHVFDMLDLFMELLRNNRAIGLYNVSSDEAISRRQLAEGIATTLGPGFEARSIGLEEGRKVMGELADLSVMNQLISSERARREIGWRPRRPPLMRYLLDRTYGDENLVSMEAAA